MGLQTPRFGVYNVYNTVTTQPLGLTLTAQIPDMIKLSLNQLLLGHQTIKHYIYFI